MVDMWWCGFAAPPHNRSFFFERVFFNTLFKEAGKEDMRIRETRSEKRE
jgi:hypothetical protein